MYRPRKAIKIYNYCTEEIFNITVCLSVKLPEGWKLNIVCSSYYKVMENVMKEMSTYIKCNDVFSKTNKYSRKIFKLTNTMTKSS